MSKKGGDWIVRADWRGGWWKRWSWFFWERAFLHPIVYYNAVSLVTGLENGLSEEWTDLLNWFFACWHRFTKIKSSSKYFWDGMAKNECGQSDHRTIKLTVFQKWTNGINWFFACWYKFRKAKSWFNDLWVGVVKIGQGLLVHETLKSTVF